MEGDVLCDTALADDFLEPLADRPVVDVPEYGVVFQKRYVSFDDLQGDIKQLHLERNMRLVSSRKYPLLAVHLHYIVGGEFLQVHERKGGEGGEDEQITHEGGVTVGELVQHQCLQLVLRKELTLLRVRTDMELRERVSGYLAVEVRTHHHALEPHAVQPDSGVPVSFHRAEVHGEVPDEVGGEQVIQVFGPSGDSQFLWTDSVGNFSVPVSVMNTLRGGYVYIKPLLGKEFKPHLTLSDGTVLIDSIRKSKKSYQSYLNNVEKEKKDAELVTTQTGTVLLNEVLVTTKRRIPFRDKFMGRLDSLVNINLGPWVCKHGFLENYKEGYSHLMGDERAPVQCAQHSRDTLNVRRKPVIGKMYRIIKYEPNTQGISIVKDVEDIKYEGPIYTDEELLRMNNITRVKGYYGQREFYTPDSVEMLSSLPDARNTLQWSPSVQTDKNGDATVPFWTSDINTQFIGVVEGTDGLGLLGSNTFEFHVSKTVEE